MNVKDLIWFLDKWINGGPPPPAHRDFPTTDAGVCRAPPTRTHVFHVFMGINLDMKGGHRQKEDEFLAC